jgi:RNA polymerase sigma factor (sigma-70 family)
MENMDFSAATDSELLTEWATIRSEPAFRTLVERYAGLVHMAARRTCCGNDDLAREVSQTVFILLAQKAKSLASRTSLAGWLHVTAVMQAKNLFRKNQQETRKRDQLLTTMDTDASEQAHEAWLEMQPILDGALAALSEKDREALLLRFYRSLSIREVAASLGIDVSAAQKRVDRATERLREKLARRGCQAGGPLALALVAGFASDAQACAVLVPALTKQAVAVGAATTALSSPFIPLALVKTSTYIPAAAVLLLSAAWLAMQHQSTAAIEKRNGQLAAQLDRQTTRMTVSASTPPSSQAELMRTSSRPTPPAETGRTAAGGIDWNHLAEQITAVRVSSTPGNANLQAIRDSIRSDLQKMTKEELLAALREVSSVKAPARTIDDMENFIATILCRKDPVYSLEQLTDRLGAGRPDSVAVYLEDAFNRWIKTNPAAATAWLDKQIEAGSFENRTLSGTSYLQSKFEGNLMSSLLATDPAAAARRLESIPAGQRDRVLFGEVKSPESRAVFAALVREHFSEGPRIVAFTQQIYSIHGGYETVNAYLRDIRATGSELEACVKTAASNRISSAVMNKQPVDYQGMRAWAESHLPGSADRITGATLGDTMVLGVMGFPEAARLAEKFADAGDADAVLIPFLESEGVAVYKEPARKLAAKISDPAARDRILEKLK